MDIYGYSAHVLVNGRKVKEYTHNGLTYIEAKEGTEFSIEVKNHHYGRVVAIISVDGIDVVDGKPATSKSRGYILNGTSAETIRGYRRSQDEIAAFKFTNAQGSYAADKGAGQNNGIIAVKFVGEAIAYAGHSYKSIIAPPSYPKFGDSTYGGTLRRLSLDNGPQNTSINYCAAVGESASASMSTSASAPAASFDMGTTWGSVREDKTTEVPFKYGAELGTIEFYYASRESLNAMGIPLVSQKALPQAFADSKYAQPPSNWRA